MHQGCFALTPILHRVLFLLPRENEGLFPFPSGCWGHKRPNWAPVCYIAIAIRGTELHVPIDE